MLVRELKEKLNQFKDSDYVSVIVLVEENGVIALDLTNIETDDEGNVYIEYDRVAHKEFYNLNRRR